MIASMTGFALKNIMLTKPNGSTVLLTLSLKSLNGRFCEISCKLPSALQYLEVDAIKRLKEALLRGHVTFTINVLNPNSFKGPVQPDLAAIESYVKSIHAIQEKISVSGSFTLSDLLQLPNIFMTEEQPTDESLRNSIMTGIEDLIKEITQARIQEGKALLIDLEKRSEIMHKELLILEKAAAVFMEDKKQKISARLAAIDPNQESAESQRSALYFELDKIDINEEVVRFKSHLDTFGKTLHSKEQEKGRRLDFILQEMAREINTISAKCSDASIGHHAINIKVELEKAREQVQNIV